MPTAKWPVIRRLGKSVMDGVIVDIGNQADKVLVRINKFAVEIWYKEAAFSIVHFVEGLSISVKKM